MESLLEDLYMSIDKETDLFTGERFVPGINDTQLTMEHYQRYYSALPLVKGKIVVKSCSRITGAGKAADLSTIFFTNNLSGGK